MEVKIKKLHPDAVIPYKTYPSDFCYDVVAVSEEEVAPNVWKYGLGLAFQIERGHEVIVRSESNIKFPNGADLFLDATVDIRKSPINLSIDFRPRSSVWKTGMVLSNCQGTIDELYRGEVCAVFYHVFTDMERYHVGQKIGQIKLGITLPITFIEVDELNETERGCNGYGSTGR